MEIVITIAVTVAVTWIVLYYTLYSPKAQIRRLWKEIFEYARVIGKYNNMKAGTSIAMEPAIRDLNTKSDKVGKVINVLLDYHYADTEDEQDKIFARDSRYEAKS